MVHVAGRSSLPVRRLQKSVISIRLEQGIKYDVGEKCVPRRCYASGVSTFGLPVFPPSLGARHGGLRAMRQSLQASSCNSRSPLAAGYVSGVLLVDAAGEKRPRFIEKPVEAIFR
jgi:hypothetical protein